MDVHRDVKDSIDDHPTQYGFTKILTHITHGKTFNTMLTGLTSNIRGGFRKSVSTFLTFPINPQCADVFPPLQIRASIGSNPGNVVGHRVPLEDYVLSILGKYSNQDPARHTDTRDAQFLRIALLVRTTFIPNTTYTALTYIRTTLETVCA